MSDTADAGWYKQTVVPARTGTHIMLPILLAQANDLDSSAFAAGTFGIIVLGLIALGVYFLPTVIAMLTGSRNVAAIFFLNLLAGWTFIGWVAAFVWAWVK